MSVTMPRLMLMACLLSPSFLWPSSAWALGLGEIHLNSALNEPMNAEIDLIAATPDELTALRATLAGKDAFTRYGIDRPPFLSTLTFKVGKGKEWPRLIAGAFHRLDPRALCDIFGGRELGSRPLDARVHGAAGPAGVHAG